MGKDDQMSRTQLLDADQAPITAQQYYADGDPGPIVAALATVPELLGPRLNFVGAALGPGSVSARAKELAILRTSVLQGCRYCVHAHTAVALDVGLSTDEIRGLRGDIVPEHALVELTVTVGATMFLNRLATGLHLPTSDQVTARLSQEGLA